MKTAVIIGAGKGMGNSIARIFAQHDFRIVLISRTKASLDKYVSELAADGHEIYG